MPYEFAIFEIPKIYIAYSLLIYGRGIFNVSLGEIVYFWTSFGHILLHHKIKPKVGHHTINLGQFSIK